ncbi:MAG: serine/threonine protein kinase [Pseudanabaena frigida]|uniref:Serine/threonine protein kinase n=1 Tax=Pseudanabaena frigida TaxID=945775 RepID=A0A2W4W0X0_9CYAN|nr:MAG: serine/threonine protein kinase [Pseudanabaena frigida]
MITLPGIVIQSKIYESSASAVYRGIGDDGRAIVVKMLKQDYPSPQELTRYRQEYEITSFLNLEGVIKASSQQDYQRTLVIFLEDFGGESLEQWMRSHPETFCPMELSTFLRLATKLTDILGKIHAAHVIHKDINPGNIVLNLETGIVKIIDFGIATQFSLTNPTFRSPHVLEGTLAYLSPEQTGRMNRSLDYRTDFYSLGVTFYQLVTGHLPFPTTNILELVHCHIAKQPVLPHELNATVPRAISDIVMKLMAKNAEDRYQSAWGIKADLERCAHQLEASDRIDSFQLGLHDASNQFQIPQKLYGRDTEIATLLAAFERVVGGDSELRGQEVEENDNISASSAMMLVSGYAGIGKSALVQELYKPITAKRGYFISGKFDQFQRNIPYRAIADALQKLVRQLLSEPDEQVEQWRSLLQTALGSNGQLIVDVIPEVELIIGKQSSVPEVGATEAQNRFNRVFQQFIRVFCSKDRPLAIFLDDLQWVDSATLKLIELIMLDEQIQSLFLIGAYRDNEVNPTQPLVLTLERLRKQGAVLQEIVLAPLTLEPLSQLLAETLYQNSATVRSLAELVLRKTEGNPFFVNEFLRFLYSENLLSFDAERLSWQWNIDQIQAQDITDNVVDLMLLKLKKLPKVTQQMLCLAACVGAEFNLETLVIVCEQSPQAISLDLLAAVQAGLIQPQSELDENLLVQEYKFLHDRVQQAAYALIDEAQKQVVHLQIGRNLLEKTLPERLSERLFEIVDHLNHSNDLVTDEVERNEIARLNLIAGQKAKAAIAYRVSGKYLTAARAWLVASSWQTNYDLTLELYQETTEVNYLCGDFEQVEYWAEIVLQEAKTVLDTVKVYEVTIQTNISQNQPLKAINIALQVLQQLGIDFQQMPSQSDIRLEIDTITALFNEKEVESLIYLPEMTEPDKLAAMRILSSITIAAYVAAPDLMPLLVSKQVNLSIQSGNAVVSPFAYAFYGLILCGTIGNIEIGYEFGQLALNLLSHLNVHSLRARTLLIVNNFIIHWKEHIRNTTQPLLEAYQRGLEVGDLEFAAYSAHCYCFQFYAVGKELVEVDREMTKYNEAIRQIKQKTVLTWNQIYHQAIANLMGFSVSLTRLVGEFYNEENGLPQHEVTNDGTAMFIVFFHKLFLCYLFSEYAQAVKNSTIAERYLIGITGTPLGPFYYLYDSLARLAIYSESATQVQEELLKKVKVSQEKMKQWAQYAPMNCLHKYYLVQAEIARVLSQWFEAEEFYEQAIQGARENEYIQEEALAYELAAKHYLSRGREKFAQLYMKEAHYCYERWGATAKVKDLETRYPQFFPQSSSVTSTPIRTTAGTTSNTQNIAFDLATVMKASQAISSEIELEQLLSSLMQTLIENAGAQTGCLLLENAGEWRIDADCELLEGERVCTTQVLQSSPITNRLPESVIQYVIRTHESVILNDATREGHFINDPYIQRNQTQSLLCLPLLNQSKLVGVLYLENQLAAGAFTPERSQVLNLLSTQAAIAIEKAKLYSKLRASESQMTQFLEAIPVGIGIIDAMGRPYYVNQRGIELMGKGVDPAATPEQLSEIYQLYVTGTNQIYPTERMPIIRALSGERTRADDADIHQNNLTIPVEAWGTPVFDEQGNVVYAIAAFQDITERKQAEKLLADYNHVLEQQVTERTLLLSQEIEERQRVENALRQSEDYRRLTMDFTHIGSWNWNIVENKTDWNDNHARLLGLVPDEVESSYQAWRDRVHPEDIDRIEQAVTAALTTHTDFEAEYRVIYPDGNIRWLVGRGRGIYNADGQPVQMLGVILDISEQRDAALLERKRAEEASILEERNRMAREIHDTLAQAFTGILLHIGAATEQITKSPERAQAHMETIDELARTGLAEARRSVTTLRPKLLEEGDLYRALNRLTAQMKSSTNTHITCEIIGVVYALSPDVENNLLRIGQEALTNAIKYARATVIQVELVYGETQCLLRIKDDGQGFEVDQVYPTKGFGLLGMSERVEQIGGELIIRSQPDRGTEIIVIVNRE